MNKFLEFDATYQMFRLPLGYSLGDLDTIRMIFGKNSDNASISLPVLPPQVDAIDDTGERGYLVFPPDEIIDKVDAFIEKTLKHVRKLKEKNYDYNHPDFKDYLHIRDNVISCISEKLENIIEQERRLGIFNLFWLVVAQICINSLNDVIARTNASIDARFSIHPHVRSTLKQSLERTYEKLNYRDDLLRKSMPFYKSTILTRLGASFNFNFVKDIIGIQLCLLENTIPPIDPLHMIKNLLVEENIQYFITFEDYQKFYFSIKSWVDSAVASDEEWLKSVLNFSLGISEDVQRKLDSSIIVFEPRFILTVQDRLRRIPLVIPGKNTRKKCLIDDVDERAFDQMVLDYITLARELQKAEIISYCRRKIKLIGTHGMTQTDERKKLETPAEKITYNLDSETIVKDMRSKTIMFVDLRASTELASGVISSGQLIKTLYAFFDPALDIIAHYGGRIRFFAGDAILATFSDDNAKQEATIQAVQAGLTIQKMLAEKVKHNTLPLEGVGIGIHVGVLENAYIFSDERGKFSTVIGLSANVASRLSSGKSSSRERRADPLFKREIGDLLQDILENTKSRISPGVRDEIVNVFNVFVGNEPNIEKYGRSLHKLPEIKDKPGLLRVNVVNGVLHNNGIALSAAALNDVRKHVDLKERSWRDSNEFVYCNSENKPVLAFRPVGDAHLKGIPETTMVWSVQPLEENE
jgi:class 3 adenylate cyclase